MANMNIRRYELYNCAMAIVHLEQKWAYIIEYAAMA